MVPASVGYELARTNNVPCGAIICRTAHSLGITGQIQRN